MASLVLTDTVATDVGTPSTGKTTLFIDADTLKMKTSTGTVIPVGVSTPAGLGFGEIQYNVSGALDANNNFVYDPVYGFTIGQSYSNPLMAIGGTVGSGAEFSITHWPYSDAVFFLSPGGALDLTGTNQVKFPAVLSLPETGASPAMGVVTLVGGTATVSHASVTASSRILLTTQVPDGTVGTPYISARVDATSFTITSTSGTDTSTVAWVLLSPL